MSVSINSRKWEKGPFKGESGSTYYAGFDENGNPILLTPETLEGPQGPQGPTGPTGPQGPAGADGAQGPQGIQGPAGATGANGANGNNGADGKSILYGASNPGPSDGSDGDFWINTSSNYLFGPKVSGVWPAGVSLVGPTGPQGSNGTSGADGADGKSIRYGSSDPTISDGVDGDFWINTTSHYLFGPKASGTWPSGTSLIAISYDYQNISGNTTLSTQRSLLYVSAAATITLPALSSWTIGKPTKIFYKGTSAVRIIIVADTVGPDLIEGAAKVALYGYDIEATLIPISSNRFSISVSKGVAQWSHARSNLSTAAGASPWTINGVVWTDISSSSNSVSASSGLSHTSTAVSFWGSGLGSIAKAPLTNFLDGWSRPITPRTKMWICVKEFLASGVTTNIASNVTLGGTAGTTTPKIGTTMDPSIGHRMLSRVTSTYVLTEGTAVTSSSVWNCMLWDPINRRISETIYSVSPSGTPGVDWWPNEYITSKGMGYSQDSLATAVTDGWKIDDITHILLSQTGTGGSFTRTDCVIILETGSL